MTSKGAAVHPAIVVEGLVIICALILFLLASDPGNDSSDVLQSGRVSPQDVSQNSNDARLLGALLPCVNLICASPHQQLHLASNCDEEDQIGLSNDVFLLLLFCFVCYTAKLTIGVRLFRIIKCHTLL